MITLLIVIASIAAFVFIVMLIPIIAVTIGLPFRKAVGSKRVFSMYTEPERYWQMVDLPDWLKWFQNHTDGLMGDKRGWFTNDYEPVFFLKPIWKYEVVRMWWWSGIRNPYNYLKNFILGLDIREYTFHKLAGLDYVRDDIGDEGFSILYAKPKDGGMNKPQLYYVKRWGQSKRALVIQIGWEIKLAHNTITYVNEKKYYKGFTFEVNPYKPIN